ncbi:helix-turn-helix domain-containing protein [Actinomadura scrupuli]|uniref:PucR family transcriptional regulator n=1 Tax=Actinomadura scrupuli TaxID=559629 RepID=UPI003D9552C3
MGEEWPAWRMFRDLLMSGGDDRSLLEATVAAARSGSPPVGALPEEEVRRHVQAMVRAALTALEHGGEIGEQDLAAAGRLGADRARQGVPVAALLDGFQAGRSQVIRLAIERGRAAGLPSDDLLEGMTRIDAITTQLEHRMVHAHRITELEMARTTRDSAVQRLRQLLHGEPAGTPLDPGRAYHCVVSEVSDPAMAQRLEPGLAGSGLCGLVDGRLAALVTRPPALPDGAPLLVMSPAAPPAAIPQLYGLCRRALQAAGTQGRTGLCRLTDLALVTATAAEPELGRLLAADLLGALDPGEVFHHELVATALAYLDHGGRIEPTAAALHVHPNTVKYRVRRLQELTGHPLGGPGGGAVTDTAQWWWALRTWPGEPWGARRAE